MPYCIRLLQALILPQKLSRRVAMVMASERSGVAWISTGTLSPERRRASATPRSSPKFGSVTIIPSISAACSLKNSAQRVASAKVSTAPCFESSGPRTSAFAPAASTAAIISSRPVLAKWSGKNPRLPTTIPKVIVRCAVIFHLLLVAAYRSTVAARAKAHAVKQAERQNQTTPPDRRVQVGEDHVGRMPGGQLKQSIAQDHCAIDGEEDSNEEPDRNS